LKPVFGKNPAICTAIMETNLNDIIQECKNHVAKKPDVLEWRADFFDDIADGDRLMEVLVGLRRAAGELPIIFTIRTALEGGNDSLELSHDEKIAVYHTVCKSKLIDFVDFELSNPAADIAHIREMCQSSGAKLILSYHNFKMTPEEAFIKEKFLLAENYGADVAKVAVMPKTMEDVLDFMKYTLSIQKQLGIPMIAISMGELGVISRLFGWMCGSQLTFAIGEKSSAPGQIPIKEMQTVLDLLQVNPKG
jgi:3-dehydroquinate dehydratase-1